MKQEVRLLLKFLIFICIMKLAFIYGIIRTNILKNKKEKEKKLKKKNKKKEDKTAENNE